MRVLNLVIPTLSEAEGEESASRRQHRYRMQKQIPRSPSHTLRLGRNDNAYNV